MSLVQVQPGLCPIPLVWSRRLPFHGSNTGSNPVWGIFWGYVAQERIELPIVAHETTVLPFKLLSHLLLIYKNIREVFYKLSVAKCIRGWLKINYPWMYGFESHQRDSKDKYLVLETPDPYWTRKWNGIYTYSPPLPDFIQFFLAQVAQLVERSTENR